jgi:hypothetical protein
LVNFYQTTWRYSQEDSHRLTRLLKHMQSADHVCLAAYILRLL